ncbi:MAG: hypothetical protein OCC49_14815 [Fibrobacterales bacterium]
MMEEERERTGVQGWKQFLSNKKVLLDHFDRAKEKDQIHKVQTYRGVVAEEEFRKWLSEFLPKKYAVTSGYIISQNVSEDIKAPHYDVIIYDYLNSPILWCDDHSGASSNGKSRAIPAEHVMAVLEVKSKLNSTTVKDSINHLSELSSLCPTSDQQTDRYNSYLPSHFFCGIICYELIKQDEYSIAIFENMLRDEKEVPDGFFGVLILRGEGLPINCTGKIDLLVGTTNIKCSIKKDEISLLSKHSAKLSNSVKYKNKFMCAMLDWNEAVFSQFAFDLIARLTGDYRPGYASSMHAMNWVKPKNKID